MNAQLLHTSITEHFRAKIESGELSPGDRLPSYRDMAADWTVSMGTVRTAVAALRSEGLVTGDGGGAGTIVAEPPGPALDWSTIKTITKAMHDDIEGEFTPELVVTMSGPGGFAALLTWSHSLRLVPVLNAVTFPAREKPTASEKQYAKAAKSCTWQVLKTGKWHVYLPKAIQKYGEGARVLIFDDRVISGTTQRLAKDHMESIGLDVRTAAMIVSTDNTMNVDYFGTVIDDSFRMPWGTDRGRQ